MTKDSEIKILRNALRHIANLDPEVDSEEGWNEWGKADCFDQAQVIARVALKKVTSQVQSYK